MPFKPLDVVRISAPRDGDPLRYVLDRLPELVSSVQADAVIHRGRNLIVRITGPDGEPLVVKRHRIRSDFRGAIARLRTPKAVRAFDAAARLRELGFETPEPIAALVGERSSWFVSGFVEGRVARELKKADAPGRDRLLHGMGALVGRMHEGGVVHADLTSGNVLIVEEKGRDRFFLVDVNRVRFSSRPIGLRAGIANLVQLRFGDGTELLRGYCEARGLSFEKTLPQFRRRLGVRAFAQSLREASRPIRRKLRL